MNPLFGRVRQRGCPRSLCAPGRGPPAASTSPGAFICLELNEHPRSKKGAARGGGLGAVNQGLFYVRRHTCADGSFEWYVLNGHTRRRASNFFPTRAAAVAERRKLQAKVDLAKAKVLKRTPKV